jgi:hypothetical protein
MAKLWADFMPSILIHVPSCPDILVEAEIRNAAIALCRRSLVWRAQLDPIAVFANQGNYSLFAPSAAQQTRVIKIYDVRLSTPSLDPAFAPNIRQLEAKTVQALDLASPSWRYPQAPIAPSLAMPAQQIIGTRFYAQDSADTILLAGIPVLDGTLNILASLVPSPTSSDIDQWVGDEYHEAILHGAKARLMAIPSKPWTDNALAMYHQGEFDKAIAGATGDAAQGFQSTAPIRTTGYSK